MQLNFKGKSAVVTGASGGMGLEVSKSLSRSGISVLMLDIKAPDKTFLEKNQKCAMSHAIDCMISIGHEVAEKWGTKIIAQHNAFDKFGLKGSKHEYIS